jgi:ubiquinone/menaquinone biosynthesis C-methylase UbiE
MSAPPQETPTQLPTQGYFSQLARSYAAQTAGTTKEIFETLLPALLTAKPITDKSVVHDNAAGPGIAVQVLHEGSSIIKQGMRVVMSDNNPGMLAAAKDAFPQYETLELDSCSLSALADGSVTHSITNASISTIQDPVQAVREIHRTLAPDGVALVTTFKRFAMIDIVHEVQRRIRPDAPKMPLPGPQFLQEGVLEKTMIEGGFEREKMESLSKEILVTEGERIAALTGFLTGPFMERAKEGWSAEDKAKWDDTVSQVMDEEKKQNGGVRFAAWAVLARK